VDLGAARCPPRETVASPQRAARARLPGAPPQYLRSATREFPSNFFGGLPRDGTCTSTFHEESFDVNSFQLRRIGSVRPVCSASSRPNGQSLKSTSGSARSVRITIGPALPALAPPRKMGVLFLLLPASARGCPAKSPRAHGVSILSSSRNKLRFEHHGPQAENPVKWRFCEYRRSINPPAAQPTGPALTHFRQSRRRSLLNRRCANSRTGTRLQRMAGNI